MSLNPVDPVLIVAWLVLAHLLADFVLQNDWIAMNKGGATRTRWAALSLHGFHVALCLTPVVFAFGIRGAAYLAVVALTHMVVDRWKTRATRRMDEHAQARAREQLARRRLLASGLGSAWTPWPGMLFLADQVLHLSIALAAWLVILEGEALLPGFADFIDAVIRGWDPAAFHAAVLTGVVLVSLFLVNTRGAFYFSMALASPRELRPAPGEDASPSGEDASPAGPESPPAGATVAAPGGASARIAATAMAMERLLVAALVLTGLAAVSAIVVALDVAARWRQLGDRGYAEWYLVATLASLSVALGSALLALAALSSLG